MEEAKNKEIGNLQSDIKEMEVQLVPHTFQQLVLFLDTESMKYDVLTTFFISYHAMIT